MVFAADVLPWGEFGLAGLVIGALFAFIVFVIRTGMTRLDEIHQAHRDERTEWRGEVTQRHKEWSDVTASRQAATDKVIDKLAETIRENSEVTRDNWKLLVDSMKD